MADITKTIGLSLGADICWPICYEAMLERLDLAIPSGRDVLRFRTERVTIEPFDLRQPCRYDVVIDRLTHWYHTSREWIKKAIILDGLYVFNNPWTLQSMEKQTTYCAMMKLGLPVPDTWLVPPKSYEHSDDLQPTLRQYARFFDLGLIGKTLGYPLFMKPYDGGGWVGVNKIDDEKALRAAYEESGKRVMNLQAGVFPHDRFVRCLGLGPQVRFINYDPAAPLHDRYRLDRDFMSADEAGLVEDMTLTINTFFGWDFNSCEVLRKNGVWYPIDFANACPDSQVTSLHYHFPWLILANLRWSIFCAATDRPMRMSFDWAPYFEIAERDLPYRERLRAYAAVARERLDAEAFEVFCTEHLAHLEDVAREFFASEEARDAVRRKVTALFPAREIDEFTELFFGRIQRWRTESAAPASLEAQA
ncbi:MAG: ATP-grasp domain-containing protein [Gammaproteobacteria bacterium]